MEKEVVLKPTLIRELGKKYRTDKAQFKRAFGLYKCNFCNTEFEAFSNDINTGNVKSCGCLQIKPKNIKERENHGECNETLYNLYSAMKQRCYYKKGISYPNYGGRGIEVCSDWKDSYIAFKDWAFNNGYVEGLSLDRIDNDGDYCPENCRWVTKKVQNRNTRRLRKDNTVGYRGVTKSIKKSGTIRYISKVSVDGKKVYIGSFGTALEGAIAYDNYIIENNLEHTTNFNRKGDYK